jgi:glycosyltransferase involved in cell wall biosynthesis
MIAGMLRVKNEQRWIGRVLESIQPLCDRIFVLDDHSTDETAAICRGIPGVTVFDSPFEGLDESRDKNWLLDKVREVKPAWVVAIDGDEILAHGQQQRLLDAMKGPESCLSLRILYLWNDWKTVRVDGVYGDFHRESVFRPSDARFSEDGNGVHFHCGNVPMANRRVRRVLDIPLLHTGYMHREDRERKFAWYNAKDPGNVREDSYRHMVIGDIYPASEKFAHAGPLKLESLAVTC